MKNNRPFLSMPSTYGILLLACFLWAAGWNLIPGPSHASGPTAPPAGSPGALSFPPLSFRMPAAQKILLENGMTLFLFEDHELPLLNISVMVRTGSVFDPQGKEGLAELTATLMRTGGTRDMGSDALDNTLESFAGILEWSMGMESASATFSVLRKDMDRGMSILAQVLTQPAFEEKKLELARELKLEELRRIIDDPQKLAFREFNRRFYQDDPRGRLPTSASVRKIAREDLFQFHGRFFHPGNVMMALSGDISQEEAVRLMREHFGGWKKPGEAITIPPAPARPKGRIYFIPKDVPQSIIIVGYPAPGKKSSDRYAFEVLDFILGSGGFTSRIFQRVRTEGGLAYSAGSFYRGRSDHGLFAAYGFTKGATTGKVLALLRDILRSSPPSPVETTELALAKKSILNSFIFSFQSASQIARQQMQLAYEGLPGDYLSHYRDRMARVTAQDLASVASRYLREEEAVILVLGNEKTFDQSPSGFGEVIRLDVLPE